MHNKPYIILYTKFENCILCTVFNAYNSMQSIDAQYSMDSIIMYDNLYIIIYRKLYTKDTIG